nr:zinc finger protein 746-like [Penaeus vannamei]
MRLCVGRGGVPDGGGGRAGVPGVGVVGGGVVGVVVGGGEAEGLAGDVLPALECPECGKLFYGRNRRQLVERHRIIHTGEKPFQCPLCFKRMNVKHHLTRHLRTVHLSQWEHLKSLNLV